MEMPKKPELEYEEYVDSYGVSVRQLTKKSEAEWSNYLHMERLARIAIWRANNEEQATKEV